MSRRPSAAALAATAHHEAGHAVAAVLRGVKLRHATIASDGDAAGHVLYLGSGRPRSLDDMHRRGMIAMAGEGAQRRGT